MLGKLLFIVEQLGLEALVLLVRSAPRAGPGEGEGVERSVFELHEGLGGGSGDLHIIAGEEEHVRGGVGSPQNAVRVQQASIEVRVKAV